MRRRRDAGHVRSVASPGAAAAWARARTELGEGASGGRIDIETTRKNGHLEIKVQDNGLGIPFGDTDHLSEGVGLSNTRRRLKHLYGEKHKFSITPTGGQGVVVGLEIPFRNYQGIKAS